MPPFSVKEEFITYEPPKYHEPVDDELVDSWKVCRERADKALTDTTVADIAEGVCSERYRRGQ
eukprot:8074123-Lingulodinium_polyedra.AAC.1